MLLPCDRDFIYRVGLSAGLFVLVPQPGNSAVVGSDDGKALTEVTQNLCHSQVAMLGESAMHGDGHTLAFKVALVERLVNVCGFDSIFFEAEPL